jgi:hypothetical protein
MIFVVHIFLNIIIRPSRPEEQSNLKFIQEIRI